MSIHNRLGPCLLHLNRWFPKEIVNKILWMAGPCAVQMALLAHNKEKEMNGLKESECRKLVRQFIRHGEVDLFRWSFRALGADISQDSALRIAAAAGNIQSIQMFSDILRFYLKDVSYSAIEHDRVNVLAFLREQGHSVWILAHGVKLFVRACKRKSVRAAQWLKEHYDICPHVVDLGDMVIEAIRSGVFALVEMALSFSKRDEAYNRNLLVQRSWAIARIGDTEFLDTIIRSFPESAERITLEAAEHGLVGTLEWAISRRIRSESPVVAVEAFWLDLWKTGQNYLDRLTDLARKCNIELSFGPPVMRQIEEQEEKKTRKIRAKRSRGN